MSENTQSTASKRRRALPVNVDASASITSLQSLAVFQAANAHIFPSVASLRWFYRQHRAELIEAGAVVEIGGRLHVNAPIFAAQAIEIGGKVAAARERK